MFSHILQLKRLRHFTGYFEPFLQSLNHLPYNHFHLPSRDQNWNLGKATFHRSCELIKKTAEKNTLRQNRFNVLIMIHCLALRYISGKMALPHGQCELQIILAQISSSDRGRRKLQTTVSRYTSTISSHTHTHARAPQLLLRFVCLGAKKSKTKHVIIFSVCNNWQQRSIDLRPVIRRSHTHTQTLNRHHRHQLARQRTSALYVPVAVSLRVGIGGGEVLAPAPHTFYKFLG